MRMFSRKIINSKKRVLIAVSFILSLGSACGDPVDIDQKESCCELPDGSFSYQTSDACKKESGTMVDNLLCEEPVSICCQQKDGSTSHESAKDCHKSGGMQVALDRCKEVSLCCEMENGSFSYQLESECKKPNGIPSEIANCQDECCQLPDGSFSTLPHGECKKQQGMMAAPERCEPIVGADICCRLPDGSYSDLSADNCKKQQGSQVAADLCLDDICCKLPDGSYSDLNANDCKKQLGTEVAEDLCRQEEKDVCCKLPDGSFGNVNSADCKKQQGTEVAGDLCLEVCCEEENIVFTTLAGNCGNTVATDRCEKDGCCQDRDGNLQMSPINACIAPSQIVATDACRKEIIWCCQVEGGLIYANQADCEKAGGAPVPSDLCEQEVCCKTAMGAQFTPASDCAPGQQYPSDRLCKPEPPKECKQFRAVNMKASSLPFTTTTGITLQTAVGSPPWMNTYPLLPNWGGSCLILPQGNLERVAVGYFAAGSLDGHLTFASPVSEFYIATFHQNLPGDELVIGEPSTITPTSCGIFSPFSNGGVLGGEVRKVTLNAPSSTVTIKDLAPDISSGYSVMLAECVDSIRIK